MIVAIDLRTLDTTATKVTIDVGTKGLGQCNGNATKV